MSDTRWNQCRTASVLCWRVATVRRTKLVCFLIASWTKPPSTAAQASCAARKPYRGHPPLSYPERIDHQNGGGGRWVGERRTSIAL